MNNIFFIRLLICLLLLPLLACQPKNNKAKDIPVEKTIRIDAELSKKNKGDCDKMIDIESVSFIPLKMPENDLIGNIKKILFINDTIVILDRVREAVLFFDEKGNFLSKISRKGRGPGEYHSISNISITAPDTLNVLDLLMRSVKQYSFSGDFLREKKLDKWGYPSGYLKLGAYEYFAVYSAYLAEEKDLYYLNIHGENGMKTGYFPFMETVLASTDKPTYFFTDGENWYYRQFFDDTIYRLEGDKLIAAYRFDFGENAYPGEVLLKAKTIDEFHRLLSRKKVVVLTDFSKPVYAQLFRSERKDFPFATRNGGMSEIGLKSESIKTCLLCLIDKANKIIAHVKEDKTRTVHYLKAIVDNYLN